MARSTEFDRLKALNRTLETFWCKGWQATSLADLLQLDALEHFFEHNFIGARGRRGPAHSSDEQKPCRRVDFRASDVIV